MKCYAAATNVRLTHVFAEIKKKQHSTSNTQMIYLNVMIDFSSSTLICLQDLCSSQNSYIRLASSQSELMGWKHYLMDKFKLILYKKWYCRIYKVTDINMHFPSERPDVFLWLNDGLVVACISNLSFHSIQGRCTGMNNKGLHCWIIRKTLCTKMWENLNIKWLLCTMICSFLHFRREAASVGVQPEWRVEWSPVEEWPGLGTQ